MKIFSKKLWLLVATFTLVLALGACTTETDDPDPDPDPECTDTQELQDGECIDIVVNQAPVINGAGDFSVAFGADVDFSTGVTATDEEDGDLTSDIAIDSTGFDNGVAGTYSVTYSVTDSEGESAAVTITVTVNEEEGPSAAEMIAADIAYYANNQYLTPQRLNLLTRGGEYGTSIAWDIDSEYIYTSGLIMPPVMGSDPVVVEYTGTFTSGDESVTETYTITIDPYGDIVLAESREVPFTNLTTEYDVADGSLMLYFEDGGSVPYVDVEDFFGILEGFVDPETNITFTELDDTLTLFYQYYDEDEDTTYDLEVVIDATANTITTNDMGFYWAYVYSTETNYGRHIEYVENLDEHYLEGSDVVYELNPYRLDIVDNDNGIFLPYYIVNQLFAGSSYYNVYYNYDGLFGIYSLPDTDSEEFEQIHTSTMNNELFTPDLVLHNYDMLAFNLDYFYGLKDHFEIDTFYDELINYQRDLLSLDADRFDDGLFKFLNKNIDEPHTSYGYPSYYTSASDTGPSVASLADFGANVQYWYNNLFDIDDAIGAKWGLAEGNAWNAYSGNRPYYWFLDDAKTSVVITLDDFNTSDIVEGLTYDVLEVNDVLDVTDASTFVPAITEGSKFFYYNSSTDDNNILEILVKDVTPGYLATYQSLLVANGYTLVQETTDEEDKELGYYTKTVGDITYMVQVNYDTEYELFYLGVADETPETYEDDWLIYADVMGTAQADSAVYLEVVFEQVHADSANVTNAMLDITWNTGGNVGALYRVIGFITDQPFRTSRISADSGSMSSSYIQIVGIPTEADLNWALLVSGVSFSAANSMATIFAENDLGPIVGIQTGGGTASITPVLLPSGTAFTMSSNSLSAIRLGSGTEQDPYTYVNNEAGITPDVILDITDIYDSALLIEIFTN
jgi:hypothetical protein